MVLKGVVYSKILMFCHYVMSGSFFRRHINVIFEEYPYHTVHIIKNEWGVCENVQFSKKDKKKSEMYHRRICALYVQNTNVLKSYNSFVRRCVTKCLKPIVNSVWYMNCSAYRSHFQTSRFLLVSALELEWNPHGIPESLDSNDRI